MGLPMQVTVGQLQPQLLAAGIDVGQALADVGPRLTPDESGAAGRDAGHSRSRCNYFFVVDGLISIEPKTGALIDVHSNAEGVAVQPDLSGAPRCSRCSTSTRRSRR